MADGNGEALVISVDEHLARILATVEELPPFEQQLLDAHGCALCEDVTAPIDLPSFDNAAMDGYAVRADDLAEASEHHPVTLPVVGDLPAGSDRVYALAPGLAIRIMTGAPVPSGADTVIPVEWTDGGRAKVEVRQAPSKGQFIRRRGEDVVAGEALLSAGTYLDARHIGLLAAVGRDRVAVRPRARVVILSTGSELREPGDDGAELGRIYDANGFLIAAAVKEAGAIAYRVGIVPDEPREFTAVLEDQLIRADLVITTGGVSVGAYDIVKQELSRLGTVEFTTVAMQPGKPQGFGVIGEDRIPIFTLPGNPVSSYVSFQVFVRPALRKMFGISPAVPPTITATTTTAWRSSPDKRTYTRARFELDADGQAIVTPVSGTGSHLVAGLARANCLVITPEDADEVPAGAAVEVMPLDTGPAVDGWSPIPGARG